MEDRQKMNNDELFMKALAVADPSLWRIKQSLLATGINAELLPTIIETIAHVYNDNGWGDIVISMENGLITYVSGRSQRRLNVDVAEKIEYNNTTTSFK